jgi:murein DD-endopeptidase MepM/ murein hydrolase activator NlpD
LLIVLQASYLPEKEAAAAEAPRWPMDLGTRYLTSNFMEYRDGRFHAGIDLKTRSQEGFPVYAVEEAHIVRVRTSPGAYGRAVYLQGVSGRTYVYAHLKRFSDEIRAKVVSSQQENGRYRTQLYFSPGQWAVQKGQVLGLSGQSGTSGPHLHFEVRDARGRPLDPQAQGFEVQDTIAPIITGLTAWPAQAGTLINGQPLEHHLSGGETGLDDDLPSLTANGPVAFSARIVEKTDIRGHRLEPWLIEVELDGTLVHVCRNESYGFEQNSLQRLEWADKVEAGEGNFRERWLHRRPANTLDGRSGDLWYLGAQGMGLSKGVHRVVLRATDRAGNHTEARWDLVVGERTQPEGNAWAPRPLGVRDSGGFRLTPFLQEGVPADAEARVLSLHPEQGDPVLEPMTILVSAPAIPAPESLAAQGLSLSGPPVLIQAADWVVDAELSIPFPMTEAWPGDLAQDPRVAVYRQKDSGAWKPVGPVLSLTDGSLACPVRDPGLHAILRDQQAPKMALAQEGPVRPGPVSQIPGVTLPRWDIVTVGLVDEGSGISPATLEVQLDGQRLIAEPDLIRDRILVTLPDSSPAGTHRLEVSVEDEAGNGSKQVWTLTLEDSSP